jgi:hypothetical protein
MIQTQETELHLGQSVNVDAHGQHEEHFSGVVTGIDNDNYLVHVEAPDGETYGCTRCFVYPQPKAEA